ncbi:MAG: hypothetical protein AABZ74_09570 [Cyanobacteriota bacterium]
MSGGINGFSGGNTPIDKSEFKKLETKITNNGILSPLEKKEVFEVGLNVKDKAKLQELKQGVSPEYPEIAKLLDDGFDASQGKNDISKLTENISQGAIEKNLRKEAVSQENPLRRFSASASESLESAGKFTKNVPFLSNIMKGAEKAFDDMSLPDDKEKDIKLDSMIGAKAGGLEAANFSTLKKINVSSNTYEKKEAARANCVIDSLHEIGFKDTKKTGVINVKPELLEEMTGKPWTAIDVASSKKDSLNKILDGKDSKALVTDGGHAYVLKSIDQKTGNLNVYDASAKKDKVLNKDNTHVSVFVQGKVNNLDGVKFGKAIDDKDVQLFGGVNKLKNMNSVDKTEGKNNESWELRKMFTMMGDPNKSADVQKIRNAVVSGDDSSLKSVLDSNKINISDRERKAMISVLKAKIPDSNGSVTTMADKFLKLSKGMGNAEFTDKQNNYLKAVQYSNVDLNKYFSSSENEVERAKNMSVVMKNIEEDGEGC